MATMTLEEFMAEGAPPKPKGQVLSVDEFMAEGGDPVESLSGDPVQDMLATQRDPRFQLADPEQQQVIRDMFAHADASNKSAQYDQLKEAMDAQGAAIKEQQRYDAMSDEERLFYDTAKRDQQLADAAGVSVYDLNLKRASEADQTSRGAITGNPAVQMAEGAYRAAGDAIINPLLAVEEALGFETAGDMRQARHAERDIASMRDMGWLERQVSGVTESLAQTAALAGTGGLPAILGGFGFQAYEQGKRQALKTGKTEEEAEKIARANAAFEVGVMGAFHAMGLGGLESAAVNSLKGQGWQGVKKFAVQTLAELGEEELTTFGQELASKGKIDDPQAFIDTAAQTIGTMGLMAGVPFIRQFIDSPNKKTANAAGIPPEIAKTQQQRVNLAEAVKAQVAEIGQDGNLEMARKWRRNGAEEIPHPPQAPTSPVDASPVETAPESGSPEIVQPGPSGEASAPVEAPAGEPAFTESPPPKKRLGRKIEPIQIVTQSGRSIPAPPKIRTTSSAIATKDLKAQHQWLLDQGIAEAQSRGDDFNATWMGGEKVGKNGLPPATVDSLNQYLFGEDSPQFDATTGERIETGAEQFPQPPVVPPITRPLSTPSVAPPDAPSADLSSLPPPGDSGVADQKKVLGRKRPKIDAATFKRQVEAAAVNPDEADAIYRLHMAVADAIGISHDEYAREAIAKVERTDHSNSDSLKQRRAGTFGDVLEQRAFHGSPYKFDKFTTEKMGTGEGNQAFGWGLYFAGNKAVADFYKQMLSTNKLDSDPVLVDRRDALLAALKELDYLGFDRPGEAIQAIRQYPDWRQRWDADYDGPQRGDNIQRLFNAYDARRKELGGALYQVDLKPTDEELLDWDKPLSEQSEGVREALRGLSERVWARKRFLLPQSYEIQQSPAGFHVVWDTGYWKRTGQPASLDPQPTREQAERAAREYIDRMAKEPDGRELYRVAESLMADGPRAGATARLASQHLHSLGIRGIKYLDGSSRGKGEGSHNFVIFDDADIAIEQVLEQRAAEEGGPRGETFFPADDPLRAVIRVFEGAQDLSTLLHESFHIWEGMLSRLPEGQKIVKTVEDWLGVKDGVWTRTHKEQFARAGERYFREGKAPTKALADVFAKFKKWLTEVYRAIKGSPIDVKLTPEIRQVFDSLFTPKKLGAKKDVVLPEAEAQAAPEAEGEVAQRTPKEKARITRQYKRLRREGFDEDTLDFIAGLPDQDQYDIYSGAEAMAEAENEYLKSVIDEYDALFGYAGKNVISYVTKKGERRTRKPSTASELSLLANSIHQKGGDYTQIPARYGFDQLVDSLRNDVNFANLLAEAEGRGGTDLSSGLFDILLGGKVQFTEQLKKADDWIYDITEKYYREPRSSETPDREGNRERAPGWDDIEGSDDGGVSEAQEEDDSFDFGANAEQPAAAGVHQVGDRTWFRGDEVEVTSPPYEKHGGEWQDARVLSTGKAVTIATPRSRDARSVDNRRAFQEQQADFRRLSEKDKSSNVPIAKADDFQLTGKPAAAPFKKAEFQNQPDSTQRAFITGVGRDDRKQDVLFDPDAASAEAEGLKDPQTINDWIDQPADPKEWAEDKTTFSMGLAIPRKPGKKIDDTLKGSAVKSVDSEVEQQWQASKYRPSYIAKLDKAREAVGNVVKSFRRKWVDLDPKQYAATLDSLRRAEEIPMWGRAFAANALRKITAGLGPNKYDVFTRVLILRDLKKDLDRGLYTVTSENPYNDPEPKQLPFGYTPETLQRDLEKFEQIAKENPDVTEAIDRRQQFMTTLRNELVDRGLLPESVKEYDDYFHHQVLQYLQGERFSGDGIGKRRLAPGKKGWQRSRIGSEKNYNTEYLDAEFAVISQAMQQIKLQDLLKRVRQMNDLGPHLKELAGTDWRKNLPEGYVTWQPVKGNVFYPAMTINDRALQNYLDGIEDLTLEDFRQVWARGARREEWIIPKELAKTLDNFRPEPDHALEQFIAAGMNRWKKWRLTGLPFFLRYNLNNFSGDLDITLAADPAIAGKHAASAARELRLFHKGNALTPELSKAIEYGVIGSGRLSEVSRDAPTLTDHQFFSALYGKDEGLIKKLWKKPERFTAWREDILRLAAYRRALELLNSGKNVYWATNRDEIDQMRKAGESNEVLAARLARDLIGDYGNISQAGTWIRSHLVPFWSWLEINAPRYVRLFNNTLNDSGDAGRVAKLGAKKAAGLVAKRTLQASMLYGAVNLWNGLMMGDLEDELSEEQKQDLHIVLGRREDGSVMTMRLEGALSDALGWVGLENMPVDMANAIEGKTTLGELGVDAAKAPVNRIVSGSMPFWKTLGESALGGSFYPDAFDPRPVRDPWEHLAGLYIPTWMYRKAAGKPDRTSEASDILLSLLTYTTDPGEAAYYTVRNLASEWQREQGDDPGSFKPSARANALYYHKQSIKYGDQELAEKWLARYMAMGGKDEGLGQSIERSHPIGFMSKIDKASFVLGMDEEEQKVYRRAVEWYRKTYTPDDGSDPINSVIHDGATEAAQLAAGVGKPIRKGKDDPRFDDPRRRLYSETPEDYQKRLDPWLEKQAAAEKWLQEHEDSPVVQEAVEAVRSKRGKKKLGRRVAS